MATPISYANLYKSIEPVMRKSYGLAARNTESQFDPFFHPDQDDQPVRHANEYAGHGQYSQKTENDAVTMGDFYQSSDKTWRATTHAGGFALGFESVMDTRLREIKSAAGMLGEAAKLTPNYLTAQFLDRAFNSSYPANWDGLELCSDVHTLPDGLTTYANELATPQPLSETAMQNVLTNLRTMPGPHNMIRPERPECLVVPSALEWMARKIKNTQQNVGTDLNDSNEVRKKDWQVEVFDFLTSTTRYFVTTKNPNGLFWTWIQRPQFLTDNVIMNLQKIYIGFFRAMWGCEDARGIYGVAATT